jgi:short-subunit dehydrogenase
MAATPAGATSPAEFRARYGPWALVTGGSEGVGASWADAIAARGLHLVLLARRAETLEETASRLRQQHGIEVRTLSLDITDPQLLERLDEVTHDLDVGLVVHNVGSWEREHGWFLDDTLDQGVKVIEVNCVAPMKLAHTYGSHMRDRGRGGIVLVGSMSGMAGQALEATYSAAKAFSQHFAEALWSEFREHGVDVVSVLLGGTRTPALDAKGMLGDVELPTPDEVVLEAMEHLDDGPVFVPIEANRQLFDKVNRMSRRDAAERMARIAYKLVGKPT